MSEAKPTIGARRTSRWVSLRSTHPTRYWPLLAEGGCHIAENGYAWTDGALDLPARIFAPFAGPFSITVEIERPAMRYPLPAPSAEGTA